MEPVDGAYGALTLIRSLSLGLPYDSLLYFLLFLLYIEYGGLLWD